MLKATPAGAPDATGRRTAYLPSAVLGNGSLLVTLSARGELELTRAQLDRAKLVIAYSAQYGIDAGLAKTVRQGGHQACPFEALEGGTGNGKGHAGSLRAGFGPRRTAGRTAAFKLPMGGPKRNRWRRDVRQRRPSSARVRSMR